MPIITLTLRSAKRLYWDPLREMNSRYGLNLEFRLSENAVYFPNGSKVFLNGAENMKDIEKLRGGSYKLVLIDECKSFDIYVFRELVDDILRAATNDCNGTICVIGTPGSILEGPFYEATCPGLKDEDGDLITRTFSDPEPFWEANPDKLHRWSRHSWSVQENVHCPQIWQDFLEDKKRKKWSDDNPTWQREALGRWVSMGETSVYALNSLVANDGGPSKCRAVWQKGRGDKFNENGLSKDREWRYLLGMDLGFNDDLAIVVVAYCPTINCLYQVYEFKAQHMIVPQIASLIKRIQKQFDIEAMVADTGNLAKMVIETLNTQYGFFFEPAEKSEKFDYIELFNSDMYDGKLKILHNSELYREMMHLQWDLKGFNNKRDATRRGKLKEDPKQDNHLCDAILYTWRFSLHHFSREAEPELEVDTTEYWASWDEQQYQEACDKREKQEELIFEEEWTTALFDEQPW